MTPFSTRKLDEIVTNNRLQLEEERQSLIAKTQQWLDQFASDYGIEKAHLFGSVTKPGKFHQNSDIDLAVEQINPDDYCTAISLLSAYLGREVDIIKLDACHFAERIRQTGMVWTKTL